MDKDKEVSGIGELENWSDGERETGAVYLAVYLTVAP